MRNYNNMNEKLLDDIRLIQLGLSLLSGEIKKEMIEDPKAEITNDIKNRLVQISTSMKLLEADFIPEILDSRYSDLKDRLKKSNKLIRELELKKGDEISEYDVVNKAKTIKKQVESILNKIGINSVINVNINEYCCEISLNYISAIKSDSFFAKSQKEIDECKEKNKKSIEKFKKYFDWEMSSDNNLMMKLTERNIKTLKSVFENEKFNFIIENIETDFFEDMCISKIILEKKFSECVPMLKLAYGE